MKFQHPEWLHALWLVLPLLILRWRAVREASSVRDSLVAKRLRDWLSSDASPRRSMAILSLQLLAFIMMALALAQPIWGVEKKDTPDTGKNLMFVIDTSRSMLADDVRPNRLTRAKLAAESILAALPDYRVGLIAFAGRGYLQAPLTSDHEAVAETIQALDTETIPKGGTLLSGGIQAAREAFKKTEARSHGIVLFSDGGDEDPGLAAELKLAKEAKITIMTIGVGTQIGSTIPDPEANSKERFIIDPSTGSPVHTRLDDRLLKEAATATGGYYLTLDARSLTGALVDQVMRSIDATEAAKKETTTPIQRFHWPLSLGILALMAALLLRPLRPVPQFSPATASLALGLGLFLWMPSPMAQAGWTSRNTDIKAAAEAFEGQNFQRARDLYARSMVEEDGTELIPKLAYGLAAASHKLKDYDRALENYSIALGANDLDLQQRAHQGLGTALFDQGVKSLKQQPDFTEKVWTDSIRHYDAALKISPNNKIAANRLHVQKLLDELHRQQEAKNPKKNQKDPSQDSDQENEEGEDGEQSQQGKQSDWKDSLKKLQDAVKDFLNQQKPGQQQPSKELEKLNEKAKEFLEKSQQQQQQQAQQPPQQQDKKQTEEMVQDLEKPTDEFLQKQDDTSEQKGDQQAGTKEKAQEMKDKMAELKQQLQQQEKAGQQGEKGEQGKGNSGEKDQEQAPEQQGSKGEQGEGQQQGKQTEANQSDVPMQEGKIETTDAQQRSAEEQQRIQELLENKVMEETGFSRNQARELLEQYSDRMQTRFQLRQETPLKKNW